MKLKLFYSDGGIAPNGVHVLHSLAVVSNTKERERYQRYLGGALGSVVRHPENCDAVLTLIAAAQRGEPGPFEYDADDVELNINAKFVQVNIVINEDWTDQAEGRIDTEIWKQVLEGKKRFLALPKTMESVVEIDFPSI
jgi:hypothetical protein